MNTLDANWIIKTKRPHRIIVCGNVYPSACNDKVFVGRIESTYVIGHNNPVITDIKFGFKSHSAASRWVNKQKNKARYQIRKWQGTA
jgi:hypothetical protein